MSRLESFGAALIVVGALLGVVLALGLYQWEASSREALALANPSPTPTIAPPPATPTAIPTATATSTPVATATVISSPTAAAVAPSPAAGSPTAAATAAATPSAVVAAGDATAGAKVFSTSCNACHPKGKAGIGPALYGPQFTALLPDDAAIKAVIRSGRGGMPAFAPDSLSDTDLTNVVAYLHTLK